MSKFFDDITEGLLEAIAMEYKEGNNKMKKKREAKLKPCPFCGGEAHKRIAFPFDPDGMEMNMYIVGCKTCDIEFSRLWDEDRAIELWNNRPVEDRIREKAIDEFAERIKDLNITKAFVPYLQGEKDLSEFIDLASDDIAEQLKIN